MIVYTAQFCNGIPFVFEGKPTHADLDVAMAKSLGVRNLSEVHRGTTTSFGLWSIRRVTVIRTARTTVARKLKAPW